MYISTLTEHEKEIRKSVSKQAGKAVFACISACVLVMVLQLICVLVFPQATEEIPLLYTQIAIYCISFIVPFGLLTAVFKFLFKKTELFSVKRNAPKKPVLYILGTLGIGYLLNLIVTICFTDFVDNYTVETGDLPTTAYGIALLYISNTILPAIFEECAFRGIICKNLLPYGKNGAIIISSLLFGIMHIDPPRIIFTTAIGIMLAICYEYTGSLRFPILIHFINNAYATTASLLIGDAEVISVGTICLSMLMYTVIGCGIAALIYYIKCGINHKKFSLRKKANIGYKLPAGKFLMKFVINFGMIPLALIYIFFYYLYFIAS